MARETWVDIDPSGIEPGQVLRVKRNAYATDAGALHNGRMVEVLRVISGDVYVKTVDEITPEIHEARHPPYKLEKRI
jgi:hypothetical protein